MPENNMPMELSNDELDTVAGGSILSNKLAVFETDTELVADSASANKFGANASGIAFNEETFSLANSLTIVD